MDDTRNAITNFEGKTGILSWPNLDDLARVVCSADCSDIYGEENERSNGVGLGDMGESGLLQMNLRSVEGGGGGEGREGYKTSSGGLR